MIDALRNIWGFILSIGDRMDKIHMGLISAGVAFYAMFAVFPGLDVVWRCFHDGRRPASARAPLRRPGSRLPA